MSQRAVPSRAKNAQRDCSTGPPPSSISSSTSPFFFFFSLHSEPPLLPHLRRRLPGPSRWQAPGSGRSLRPGPGQGRPQAPGPGYRPRPVLAGARRAALKTRRGPPGAGGRGAASAPGGAGGHDRARGEEPGQEDEWREGRWGWWGGVKEMRERRGETLPAPAFFSKSSPAPSRRAHFIRVCVESVID